MCREVSPKGLQNADSGMYCIANADVPRSKPEGLTEHARLIRDAHELDAHFVRGRAQSIKESSHASRGSLLDTRPGGQEVKTSPFHGGNTGSIPVRVIFYK